MGRRKAEDLGVELAFIAVFAPSPTQIVSLPSRLNF
jgi:hypothetical protein